jgi:alkylated DNA repair dioxygenase AlkB
MTPASINQHHEQVKLPLDCEADYFPNFLAPAESEEIFDFLCRNYDLSPDTIRMADGSLFQNDRGKYLFADPELTDFEHLPEALGKRSEWPPILEMVKTRLEAVVGREFNVCLCIHYRSGSVEAGFHSDMPEFGPVSFITVISLGTEREFVFRSKQDASQEYRLVLRPGSLLTMGENCQERYEHAVPADPDCRNPRISLSYRLFGLDHIPYHP